MTLAEAPLVLMLVGLAAYAVLGGADFGAAFWQLAAHGDRAGALREHAYRSMGPVWEANHVWLVFVLVVCWTAYPQAFASIFSTLTIPLFIAALGIILRGTAYAVHAGTAREIERRAVDGVFSVSSILTPFALGTAVGAIASGRVPVGNARGDLVTSWLNPSSIAVGILAVATGAYVAAAYLAGDAARAGLDDVAAAFRARALGAGVVTGAIAFAALAVVAVDAERVGERLLEWPALGAVAASAVAGVSTLEFVRRSRFEAARYGASVAVASVVVGWAFAQRPQLLPDFTVEQAAAGRPTLVATVVGVAVGAVVVVPSMAVLFRLILRGRFDSKPAAVDHRTAQRRLRPRRVSLARFAIGAAAIGLPLTLIFDDGPFLAIGIFALLSFAAVASVALATAAAANGRSSERGQEPEKLRETRVKRHPAVDEDR
jgi:cytochrome d ubiquinol oxidase subunit II